MNWVAALVVAICAGAVWTCSVFALAPNPRTEDENTTVGGLAFIAGIALAIRSVCRPGGDMRGALSFLATRLYFGARMALQGPPAPQDDGSGPLSPECCDCDDHVWAVGSMPMPGGADPSTVPGSRASAMAWAEAISQAGAALCDEGFEDEALQCFLVAGSLLEKVEAWGRRT